jgi:hypothetical protein
VLPVVPVAAVPVVLAQLLVEMAPRIQAAAVVAVAKAQALKAVAAVPVLSL